MMTIYRKGEPRRVSTKRAMPLVDALEKLRHHGFDDVSLNRDLNDRMPVVILQDWWACGREVAYLHRTRGKYRGNSIGFALRSES